MERLQRALAARDADWKSVAFAYAAIVVGTALVLYGVVAQ